MGNVLSGMINVISASVPGIDQVYNANPLSDGVDAETDQAFRSRFQGYLTSRSRATLGAVQNAIASVRQGLDAAIAQNTAPGGTPQIGALLVVVDDGTGYPSADLLSSVASAVDAVRPVGTTVAVVPPQVLIVNVSLAAEFAAASDSMTGIAAIKNYIATYLNGLPIGAMASITRVAQQAYRVGSGLQNVSNIQLNGASSDLVPSTSTVVKAGQVVVLAQ
jgi:uncharacterized phage protein gp47/JayE